MNEITELNELSKLDKYFYVEDFRFECTSGSHFKAYTISIHYNPVQNSYEIKACYGRIGNENTTISKGVFKSQHEKNKCIQKLFKERKQKGYSFINGTVNPLNSRLEPMRKLNVIKTQMLISEKKYCSILQLLSCDDKETIHMASEIIDAQYSYLRL